MTTHAHQPASINPLTSRLIPGSLFMGCASVLGIAAYLEPSDQGTGTHTALGLPPCGFLTATGLPCPTCGMTTSFAHAADGQIAASLLTQPTGFLLALITAVLAILFAYATVTGMSLAPLSRLAFRPPVAIALGVLLGIGWAYTITRTLTG